MTKNGIVLRSFTYTVALTSLFVLTMGAVLISIVVGDWIYIHTEDRPLSWFIGIIVMLGFLATLGTGVGVWLWFRGANSVTTEIEKEDSMDRLLSDIEKVHRD